MCCSLYFQKIKITTVPGILQKMVDLEKKLEQIASLMIFCLKFSCTYIVSKWFYLKSEVELMRKKLEGNQRTQSQSDQMVRELQSRESDLMEALQAKDSQLGVLRIRLEEADKQIESKQKSIAGLEGERSRSVRN